jgi:hypothetical protein
VRRTISPYSNMTPVGGRRRTAPRPLVLIPVDDDAARAEAAVAAAALLRDLDLLVDAGLLVAELHDGEVRYAPAPDAPGPDEAA